MTILLHDIRSIASPKDQRRARHVSRAGMRTTAGLPSTGLSYAIVVGTHQKVHRAAPAAEIAKERGWLWIAVTVAIVARLVWMLTG